VTGECGHRCSSHQSGRREVCEEKRAPKQVPLTQEPGSAQRLTRGLVVARRAAAVANRAPPAVRELAIEIPDRVVVAFVAGAVTGVGHERVSRDRPKIPDLWRGVGHVSISAHRGLRSHVTVTPAMFVPRAAQLVRPSASLRACGSVVCTDGPSAAGSPPGPACSSDAQLLLGWVTQQVVGATVPAVVARGIHDAKRLWRSRD